MDEIINKNSMPSNVKDTLSKDEKEKREFQEEKREFQEEKREALGMLEKSLLIWEKKLNTDFQNYQFLEMGSILSLNGVWNFLQEILTSKISNIKEIDNLDFDSMNLLQGGIDDFTGIISEVNSRVGEPVRKTAQKQSTSSQGKTKTSRNDQEVFEEYVNDYFEWQHKKIDLVLGRLPDIFANVIEAFMLNVNFSGRHQGRAASMKFQVYNLVLRFPKNDDYHDIDLNACDFDYGHELLTDRSNSYRQHLMQGFDAVELMIQHLRNHSQHKHHKDGIKILKKDLERSIEDPITGAESIGNIITLCSALTLCAYQFDEIIQTWIDTITFIGKKGKFSWSINE